MALNLGFMKEHKTMPAFKAGEVIKCRITSVKDTETGVNLILSNPERSGVLHDHLYINGDAEASPQGVQIARDKLALIMDQIDKPIETTEDLLGEEITVRVVIEAGAELPGFSMNVASANTSKF